MSAASCAVDARRWRHLDQQMLDDPMEALLQHGERARSGACNGGPTGAGNSHATPGGAGAGVGASSRGRPWRGLSVWLQTGPVEDLYIPPTRKHCLVIRRAPATRLFQRQGALSEEREWRCGEVLLVPAGTPSFWRSAAARDNLHVDLDPLWLARAAGDERGAPPLLRHSFGADDALLRHFACLLLDSLDSNASLSPAFADGQAIGLATHLLEHYAQVQAAPPRTGALTRRQLERVFDAINADLAQAWSLEQLADLLALSPFHFARAFKAACGETPHRHLVRVRLERARQQVLASPSALIDIAVDNGFASLSHFGQAFRRQWGVSPSQLRRPN